MELQRLTRRRVSGITARVAGGSGAAWLLAACGAAGSSAGGGGAPNAAANAAAPAKITFWARGSQEFTDMMASIAKAYSQANPQITIDGGYFPSDGYNDRLVAAAA